MIVIGAIPNSKHTRWHVVSFYEGIGCTNFHYLSRAMPKEEAHELAEKARELLGVAPPRQGGEYDFTNAGKFDPTPES